LTNIYLANNNLSGLPIELLNCGNLVELGLEGNPLLPSIYQLGMSAIRGSLTTSSDSSQDSTKSPPILHDSEIDIKDLVFGDLLGEGAFGRVYKGTWKGKEIVAIKRLVGSHEKTLEGFRREVGVLSKLKPHPHLVAYHGACTQPPNLYIVTEFISRGSLHDLLQSKDVKVGPDLRLKFARGAAMGCHYLHCYDPPLYHRDLKTKNMLVTDDMTVKLSDFGLAYFDDENPHINDWTYAPFAAPEVLKKMTYTDKSDVFSFGVVLWELVTRQTPFAGKKPEDIKKFVQDGGRLPIPQNCSAAYQQLIADCWHQDSQKRPTFMAIYLRLLSMES